MKRKDFIVKTLYTGAFLATSKIFPFSKENQKILSGNPLRFPPELQNGESLVFKSASVEVWPGTTTEVLALNNSYPGPTIRVKKGDEFSVLFENKHTEESTIHWHGLLVPEIMDGQPKDAVLPNASYRYSFPIIQRAGTYFYHSHGHHYTAEQVYKGHAGFFIIEDEEEKNLGLPSGEYDIPLLIQDRHSIYHPKFIYSPSNMDNMIGYLGDLPLINGTPDAFFEVQKTLYRFRIVNGSNARVYKLAFSDNSPFWIISTDGGLKDEAIEVDDLLLSPGERIEILFDFSDYNIGETVNLESQFFSSFGGQGLQMNLLRFDVAGSQLSGGSVPQNMPSIDYYDFSSIQRTRSFTLSQGMMMGNGMHRINGLTYEINRIDENIPFNELEEWKFINTTVNFHPMHIHGILFQVYARNGNTNIPPNDKGWKDTVLVNPNETVQVLVKFTDYSGRYLLHCHNLEHEDDGMMLNIQVDQPTNVDKQNRSQESFELHQNYPNPFNPSTTIKYSIAERGSVKIIIYDVVGQEITTLVNEIKEAGSHNVIWDASRYPSGQYFYKTNFKDYVKTKKMLLLK